MPSARRSRRSCGGPAGYKLGLRSRGLFDPDVPNENLSLRHFTTLFTTRSMTPPSTPLRLICVTWTSPPVSPLPPGGSGVSLRRCPHNRPGPANSGRPRTSGLARVGSTGTTTLPRSCPGREVAARRVPGSLTSAGLFCDVELAGSCTARCGAPLHSRVCSTHEFGPGDRRIWFAEREVSAHCTVDCAGCTVDCAPPAGRRTRAPPRTADSPSTACSTAGSRAVERLGSSGSAPAQASMIATGRWTVL